MNRKLEKNKNTAKRTHAFLQNKSLTKIIDPASLANIVVLYLQNNAIENFDDLKFAVHLQCLYLQHNKIHDIKGLNKLNNLRKLYLGFNYISVVENLENLTKLEELHLEKQFLSSNTELTFDPASIAAIKENLLVLVIFGNHITSLLPLQPLQKLEILRVEDNCIRDISDVTNALQFWQQLRQLSIQGNPAVLSNLHYKEEIISTSFYNLEYLNGKFISPVTRNFIQSLYLRKAARNIKPYTALRVPQSPEEYPKKYKFLKEQQVLKLEISPQKLTKEEILQYSESNQMLPSFFPAWKSRKSEEKSKLAASPVNWTPTKSEPRRKSQSSASTELSQHLQISKM